MRCEHCNEKLAGHDLWCFKCGHRTDLLSKDLSSLKSLNASWAKYKTVKGHNFPVGIWAALFGVLPLIALIIIQHFFLPEMPKLQMIIIINAIWFFFIPILLVPFHAVCKNDGYQLSVQEFFKSFTKYNRYLLLSLISVLFYLAIFFICKGDPILNLVWLVLVLYWIAIIMPVPVLMERYQLNAWQGIKLAYKKAGDIRWNIFLMGIILTLANLLAALCLIVGLAVTIPFTWYAIRDYVDKMFESEVFSAEDKA